MQLEWSEFHTSLGDALGARGTKRSFCISELRSGGGFYLTEKRFNPEDKNVTLSTLRAPRTGGIFDEQQHAAQRAQEMEDKDVAAGT